MHTCVPQTQHTGTLVFSLQRNTDNNRRHVTSPSTMSGQRLLQLLRLCKPLPEVFAIRNVGSCPMAVPVVLWALQSFRRRHSCACWVVLQLPAFGPLSRIQTFVAVHTALNVRAVRLQHVPGSPGNAQLLPGKKCGRQCMLKIAERATPLVQTPCRCTEEHQQWQGHGDMHCCETWALTA